MYFLNQNVFFSILFFSFIVLFYFFTTKHYFIFCITISGLIADSFCTAETTWSGWLEVLHIQCKKKNRCLILAAHWMPRIQHRPLLYCIRSPSDPLLHSFILLLRKQCFWHLVWWVMSLPDACSCLFGFFIGLDDSLFPLHTPHWLLRKPASPDWSNIDDLRVRMHHSGPASTGELLFSQLTHSTWINACNVFICHIVTF